MNRVFIIGNITGDIYFDRFLIKGEERSFLRLVLMANRPRTVRGLRVVLWEQQAELFFPYLKKGSELAVIGRFQSRRYKGKYVHEIEAENLILLRNIAWKRGEAERSRDQLSAPDSVYNGFFVVGCVQPRIHFGWFNRGPDYGGSKSAVMRLRLDADERLQGLEVVVRGSLAELAHPYLRPGSKIAVDGHLQTQDRKVGQKPMELNAHHITFLENINWEAGGRQNNNGCSISRDGRADLT